MLQQRIVQLVPLQKKCAAHLFLSRFIPKLPLQVTSVRCLFQKPQQPDDYQSFVKGFFVGKLNMHWIFPFPTYSTEVDAQEVEACVLKLREFFNENVDSEAMDQAGEIPDHVMKGLKEMGVFGLQVPLKYNGLAFSESTYCRVMEELSKDPSIFLTVNAHHSFATKALLHYGNNEQKEKYLAGLATGDIMAGYCLTEPASGNDFTMLKSRAYLYENNWVLNGEKTWVTNGGLADIFIVFAKVTEIESDGHETDKISAFIVDRDAEGVTTGHSVDRIGLRAANICSVTFQDVVVPKSNLLGKRSHGFKTAMDLASRDRFAIAAMSAGIQKQVLATTADYVSKRVQFSQPIIDHVLVQDKFYEMSKRIYAAESLSYFIAGHVDLAKDADVEFNLGVECALAKIYGSESLWKTVNDCSELAGGVGLLHSYDRLIRDAAMLRIYQGSNDVLRMYAALSGVDFAVTTKKHSLNLLKHGSIRQRLVELWQRLTEELAPARGVGLLHKKIPSFGATTKPKTGTWIDPSLQRLGLFLEKSFLMFDRRVYYHCTQFGKDLAVEQQLLKRFSDAAMNLFIMSAAISRLNKTMILGLRNTEFEAELVHAIFVECFEENDKLYAQIKDIPRETIDGITRTLGKQVLDERRYSCAHPSDIESKFEEPEHYREQLKRIMSS